MEFPEDLVHQRLNLIVAEVTDTSLVGVVYLLVSMERTRLDVQSYLLISIAERHTVGGQTVHFFHREDRVVELVVEDMLVHLHLVDDIGRHLQTVLQFIEGRQEYLLDDLQVAEVAHWQVVHDEHDLLGQSLQLITLCANQFEDIGVLLMGHDTATRGAFLRQFHEREVLRVEQTGVEGHLGNGAGNGSQGEGHCRT